MRNIVLKFVMNFVFIYLGEECLVIIYSVSELAMGKVPVCFEPESHNTKVDFFNFFPFSSDFFLVFPFTNL